MLGKFSSPLDQAELGGFSQASKASNSKCSYMHVNADLWLKSCEYELEKEY